MYIHCCYYHHYYLLLAAVKFFNVVHHLKSKRSSRNESSFIIAGCFCPLECVASTENLYLWVNFGFE